MSKTTKTIVSKVVTSLVIISIASSLTACGNANEQKPIPTKSVAQQLKENSSFKHTSSEMTSKQEEETKQYEGKIMVIYSKLKSNVNLENEIVQGNHNLHTEKVFISQMNIMKQCQQDLSKLHPPENDKQIHQTLMAGVNHLVKANQYLNEAIQPNVSDKQMYDLFYNSDEEFSRGRDSLSEFEYLTRNMQ
ncbi:hypothetical protein PP175_29555 (plasmid) [Aneurinibacillus sp. Ricciae_BoGa-3]|uniref:hypothetical protein n=1 Tax=Aneurinibacillus sp. Ricciae_BoGa-3 TaxID=3022697 RepID=UPI0023410DE7|nr:hypothetical protein [Aneurinibacillus sp. Ricciae_BoGa-3]WCK57339.1 hypothetical protein PP175_29555 [Aneurinibacillus sp. Ricciae_BoGa-3]